MPGLMARLGVPVGGRVRRTRARKDNLSSLTAEVDGKKGMEILAECAEDEGGGNPNAVLWL